MNITSLQYSFLLLMVVWTEFRLVFSEVLVVLVVGVCLAYLRVMFGVSETGWRGAVRGGRDDQTHRPVTPAHTTVQQNRADREMVGFLQPSVKIISPNHRDFVH